MKSGLCLIAAFAILSTPTLARDVPAPSAPPAPPTVQLSVQQQFDAGAVATSAREWAKALDIYSRLEARLLSSAKVNPKSLALVRLRKGVALSNLERPDEAEQLISAALATLPSDDASLHDEVWNGLLALGDIAERRFDYATAVSRFRNVFNASTSSTEKVIIYDRLIRVGIFVDPQQALADSGADLTLLATVPTANREWLGVAHQLRGRTLLNLGQIPEARTELDLAIKLLGGLSSTDNNVLDIAARSEAAIAALRAHLPDKAREYLAYTGAAMQAGQGFSIGKEMNPPSCGGANGPRPDDVAVIEFSIRGDGSVGRAVPIYFTGKPTVAVEFARAVSRWSWSAEELKLVIPFFRSQTRLEMRCSTVFNRPQTLDMLWPAVDEWLTAKSVRDIQAQQGGDARALAGRRAELAGREAHDGMGSIQLVPVLLDLGGSRVISSEESQLFLARALEIARTHSAPGNVLAYFELAAADMMQSRAGSGTVGDYQRRLGAALAEPGIASDVTARSALALALYDSLSIGDQRKVGRAFIEPVANETSLPPNDPLRVGAFTRLANLEYAAGKLEEARTLYARTGLSAQQCALVDARPRQKGGSISDGDYPRQALDWGFGGWTVIEFDIDADGKTLNERPLISFPPFVFGDPTVKQIKGFRYQQQFRPDGGLGCGGQQQRVTYRYSR